MKEKFMDYLTQKGYSLTTPAGNPSTVYDYAKRIDRVCEWENMTWKELAEIVGEIVIQYNVGGRKETLGKKSNRAVINAIKRYSEFLGAQ